MYADVFEDLGNMCFKTYELDPEKTFSSSGWLK